MSTYLILRIQKPERRFQQIVGIGALVLPPLDRIRKHRRSLRHCEAPYIGQRAEPRGAVPAVSFQGREGHASRMCLFRDYSFVRKVTTEFTRWRITNDP